MSLGLKSASPFIRRFSTSLGALWASAELSVAPTYDASTDLGEMEVRPLVVLNAVTGTPGCGVTFLGEVCIGREMMTLLPRSSFVGQY